MTSSRCSGVPMFEPAMPAMAAAAVGTRRLANAQQVQAAATAIAGIAGSGMGASYGPGTEKDIGNLKTRVKPEFFQEMPNVGKLATDFNNAAANLAKVAATGDKAAVQKAFGETGETQACHDKYRME